MDSVYIAPYTWKLPSLVYQHDFVNTIDRLSNRLKFYKN